MAIEDGYWQPERHEGGLASGGDRRANAVKVDVQLRRLKVRLGVHNLIFGP